MIAKHPGECKSHRYQDAVYGPGFRVMNPTRPDGPNRPPGYRCTVCTPFKEKGKKRGGVWQLTELIVKRR